MMTTQQQPKPPEKSRAHLFQKGGLSPNQNKNGRPRGTRDRRDVRIKEAVEQALVMSGEDGNGKNGAAGYFKWLSRAEPAVFGKIVEKILPHQVTAKLEDNRTMSLQEAVKEMKERELPLPGSLLEFDPTQYRVLAEKSAEVVATDIERREAEDAAEAEQQEDQRMVEAEAQADVANASGNEADDD